MSRRRRRMFGPLFYSTLILAILAMAYTGVVTTLEGDFWRGIKERQEIKQLVGGLRDKDPLVRESCMRVLVAKGSEVALPFLLEAARDPHSDARSVACQLLVEVYADPTVLVPVLADAADDDRDTVRLETARDFGRFHAYAAMRVRSGSAGPGLTSDLKANSLETLSRLLKDRASEVRAAAAEALGEFAPDTAATAGLVTATGDKDRTVRFAAARALLKANVDGNRVALRTLLTLVADPEPVPDRGEVIEALKGTSDDAQDQAVTALAMLLSHCEPAVRPDVIDCLRSVGPRARSALPILEPFLENDDPILRASVGQAVVAILGKKSPRSVAILIAIIVDDELPRDWRTDALESLRDAEPAALTKATPGLIRQLGDTRQGVRLVAHDILGGIIGFAPAEMPEPTERK